MLLCWTDTDPVLSCLRSSILNLTAVFVSHYLCLFFFFVYVKWQRLKVSGSCYCNNSQQDRHRFPTTFLSKLVFFSENTEVALWGKSRDGNSPVTVAAVCGGLLTSPSPRLLRLFDWWLDADLPEMLEMCAPIPIFSVCFSGASPFIEYIKTKLLFVAKRWVTVFICADVGPQSSSSRVVSWLCVVGHVGTQERLRRPCPVTCHRTTACSWSTTCVKTQRVSHGAQRKTFSDKPVSLHVGALSGVCVVRWIKSLEEMQQPDVLNYVCQWRHDWGSLGFLQLSGLLHDMVHTIESFLLSGSFCRVLYSHDATSITVVSLVEAKLNAMAVTAALLSPFSCQTGNLRPLEDVLEMSELMHDPMLPKMQSVCPLFSDELLEPQSNSILADSEVFQDVSMLPVLSLQEITSLSPQPCVNLF